MTAPLEVAGDTGDYVDYIVADERKTAAEVPAARPYTQAIADAVAALVSDQMQTLQTQLARSVAAHAALRHGLGEIAADPNETEYLRERVRHVLDAHNEEHQS